MKEFKYIAFYKPYGVLCQFTGEPGDKTLSDYNLPSEVYAAGRLDKDSEGLLLLTNDGIFNQKLANPKSLKEKTYWVQVDKVPSNDSLDQMRKGLEIKDYRTRPCKVRIIQDPGLPDRDPPIRVRKNIPTSWLEIKVSEGKNRQVRRMTAKIGHPTLRLIRVGMGKLNIRDSHFELKEGEFLSIKPQDIL